MTLSMNSYTVIFMLKISIEVNQSRCIRPLEELDQVSKQHLKALGKTNRCAANHAEVESVKQ